MKILICIKDTLIKFFNMIINLFNKIISKFKKTKLFSSVEDVYQDMIDKKNDYYNHKIDKYVVSYDIIDDNHIEVKSNIGRKRLVENNKENIKKLDRVVVRSKVEIARKIDQYEQESNVRLLVLLSSIIMLSLSFLCTVASLFIGSYLLLLSSLILFSAITSLCIIEGSNLNILVKEISSLKKITGYKEESEIELPKLNSLFKTN